MYNKWLYKWYKVKLNSCILPYSFIFLSVFLLGMDIDLDQVDDTEILGERQFCE